MLDRTAPRLPQYQAYHAYRVTPKATVLFAARPTTSTHLSTQ